MVEKVFFRPILGYFKVVGSQSLEVSMLIRSFWKIENQGFGGKFKIANFKRDYLDNDNDSEFTVKTKNAPFFINFPNIYKLWPISLI